MQTKTRFRTEDEVVAIGSGLFDRTLPKTAWSHAGHFAATVWVLVRRPDLDAALVMPGVIRAYNLATGGANTDTDGYHETVTQASIRGARAFIAGHAAAPLHVLVNDLLDSPLGDPDWLFTYWSRARLFAVEARRGWVDPDLAALPFG
jgi:hypothetical protein